jgi:surfactin synthase thioesterase subunit/phosphopantetheinyl transferase
VIGAGTIPVERWFGAPAPRPHARAALFCLPYAGAGTSAFHGWAEALGAEVDVQPVALPGREGRIAEPPEIDVAEVAAALAARVSDSSPSRVGATTSPEGRPYAIYGHSMGGRLGAEVVHRLRHLGAPLPVRLYLGGCRPPGTANPLTGLTRAGDGELVARLAALGGVPAEVLGEPELLALLLPAIRADLEWIDRHADRPEPPVPVPVPVPVVAFAGADDPVAAPTEMCGWARHTTAGFRLETLPGDHFFLHRSRQRLTAAIRADLLAACSGAAPDLLAGLRAGLRVDLRVEIPAADEVHVWHATLDRLPGLAAATGELSPSEARRAARLRRAVDRDRYVARSVLLRRLLARYGVTLGNGELPRGPGGKPRPPGDGSLRFSLSHSAGTVLVAVANGQEVGVDVERVMPMADLSAFCAGAMHPDELAEHQRLPEADRLHHALALWTAKEAVLKATGDGLGVEPDRLSFAGPQARAWRPRVPGDLCRLAGWRVTHLDLPGAIGAVAVARDAWRLRLAVTP